jgi:hypothetical protein
VLNFSGNYYAGFYSKPVNNKHSQMSFGAEKAIKICSLVEVLKKVPEKVPEKDFPARVLAKVKVLCQTLPEKELPALYDVHKEVYAPLLECKTLEEAKAKFPEFAGVKSVREVKCIKGSLLYRANQGEVPQVGNQDLSLYLLKNIYGEAQPIKTIAEFLNLNIRAALHILNIKQLPQKYVFQLSITNKDFVKKKYKDPNMRRRASEAMLKFHQDNPEVASKRMLKFHQDNPEVAQEYSKRMLNFHRDHPEAAQEHSERMLKFHRDHPEAAQEHSERMLKFHRDHPEVAQEDSKRKLKFHEEHPELAQEYSVRMSEVVSLAWGNVSNIKEEFYRRVQENPWIKAVFTKRYDNLPLTEVEQKTFLSFMKNFWNDNPDFRKQYSQAMKQAWAEVRAKEQK